MPYDFEYSNIVHYCTKCEKIYFFVRHSEFENFFLCEGIFFINVTTCKTKRQANFKDFKRFLEPLRGSSNKKMYSTRSCVN
jgi:hypothetical protein